MKKYIILNKKKHNKNYVLNCYLTMRLNNKRRGIYVSIRLYARSS